MRMRPKKNRATRLDNVKELFAVTTEDGKIDIPASFGEESNISIEIGCGKGRFICGKAMQFPDENFIAFERVTDVNMMAMEKAFVAGLTNVRFHNGDAKELNNLLPPHSVNTIYLNFSDPWPKKRNAKRRLTSPLFLEMYKGLLAPDAVIYFKTDNIGLFEYSLETFAECGYTLSNVCYDLHNDAVLSANNIQTEYEEKFSEKGFTINYLEARLK
ncbi:MAG: tRNA (guanosine(46)-N7)-methyltransferase TrmB [Clostridia bacterium]|nr:tRNA (guanosine(46)-N7)-methyltransferase TrmB [Clostridia bacterium]